MRFRLHKLIFAPVGSRQVEHLDRGPTWLDDDLHVSYLRGEITFTRTNDRVLVEGVIETATQAQCARSLEMFELPLSVPLEDVAFFLPGEYTPDPDRRLREDGRIDLTETLREHIIMAMPMNPVSPAYRDDAGVSQLIDREDADWLQVKWASEGRANGE